MGILGSSVVKNPLANAGDSGSISFDRTNETFESVLMRWMKLEPIIQSEVSQKEKHQYSILMHIYGIWDITLPTKVRLVKAMVFPVVMYGCESWTTKKAKCWRIDAFEVLCWRRLLRVPWTAKRSNKSILKEINPDYSLEGLMLKLKLKLKL